jgi:hypothetical protein
VRVLLILACLGFCWAQPSGAPKPVFPDDSQDPKQAGGAELLEAVCPGHVAVGDQIQCKIACPEDTAFANQDSGWELARVTRGHFLSLESDDAALRMYGCEPPSLGFGGTILLSRKAGTWTMLWYHAGTDTGKCHKMKVSSGRQILVCLGGYGGQGYIFQTLSAEDLTSPVDNASGKRFFSTRDTVSTCGWNVRDESKPIPLARNYIERVDFRIRPDGSTRGLSVFARRGERSMTQAQVRACTDEQSLNRPHKGIDFSPPAKPYRVDFTFDGRTFKRAP